MKKSIFVILILVLSGCDIFSVRPSEEPDDKSKSTYKAFTPEELLANFSDAINKKNYDIYINCFDKNLGFYYYPLSQSIISFPVLSNWNYDKEINYFRNMYNGKSDVSVTESKVELQSKFVSRNIDSSIVNCDYELYLIKNNKDTIHASGSFSLTVRLNSYNNWIIQSWKEINRSTTYSWSDIRGIYSFE
ncbi:MAG TPA: hypothetical protein PLI27_10875 [Ignavibacteriales bacterium]|nr:hypothetical protein [Ignavibacteriales bacterium]HOL80567.1 hypothetical protein [Ignavibacteriales bacterium]HOM64257.1 hypothetical protein [Ignavibacteriales bacterium]HPD68562.1 hypothetical protein [Ignavibacteriales bacterium]HPP33097.1 hypothetical protein [Ignavibacteriales bacterium]